MNILLKLFFSLYKKIIFFSLILANYNLPLKIYCKSIVKILSYHFLILIIYSLFYFPYLHPFFFSFIHFFFFFFFFPLFFSSTHVYFLSLSSISFFVSTSKHTSSSLSLFLYVTHTHTHTHTHTYTHKDRWQERVSLKSTFTHATCPPHQCGSDGSDLLFFFCFFLLVLRL